MPAIPKNANLQNENITFIVCLIGTFAGTLSGKFLPIQLIYGGKTDQCHPKFQFPTSFHITHSENHWANESTMTEYIKKSISPYVDQIKDELDLPIRQKALVIFDCFRGQITDDFLATLKLENLEYVTIPPNCTDKLQPMDMSVNKCAKDFLKTEFQNWYAEQVVNQIGNNMDNVKNIKIDLSLTRMKPLGAKWIVKLYDFLQQNPNIVANGFVGCGITETLAFSAK